jgi:hypothetical protein
MMKHREIAYALIVGLALSGSVLAQPGRVRVRGVVFDSLRRQPIRPVSTESPHNTLCSIRLACPACRRTQR